MKPRPPWSTLSRSRHRWERGLLVAAALLLIEPGLLADLEGAALLAGVLVAQRLLQGPAAGLAAAQEGPGFVADPERVERAERAG